ncbi:glycosyltransferase [Commensalibacter nepenthis]|uniref:Glycosyltransferase n=1 Tax=Commensalibacter nepenthis TaxID=3043872 RepID=A0ABT6QBZ6_9PROT|nr:glycosyltransferase [Commensalibacter sp. TBRC 10068]MDI2113808.1 glycosyltransferase [Commensalibacter sp. TBRC 10068]
MISVNLTTTSSRLGLCSATIWSLIHQTKRPDKIFLWISHEAYLSDEGVKTIPSWIDELNSISNIVDVKFVENTGPYRKIINAIKLSDHSDILVYADDDVIYGDMWLETLLHAFYKNDAQLAIASRIRVVKRNIFGWMQSYSRYRICKQPIRFNRDYIITGVGGCVLTKHMIKESLINNNDYISLAPRTDDIWISKILELSGTVVEACPKALTYVDEIDHKNNALNLSNTYQTKHANFIFKLINRPMQIFLSYFGLQRTNNDISIKKISHYFKNK